jgi:CubicO group peptidase (beta-lactamase class C family)
MMTVRLMSIVAAATIAAPLWPSRTVGAQDRPRAGAESGAIPEARLDSVRARVRRLMDSAKVASLSIAVGRNGRIIWEEAFGNADVEGRVRATPTTLYSLASISKPMTATALMRLAEQEKIDLDRPANDYLGDAKISGIAGKASDATVRRVLSHTAGLPLHYRFFYEGGSVARPTMDEAIDRYAITVFPPGEVYSYSNLGYGVLEEIIARVSGKSYEAFMREDVFVPLGMPTATISTGAGLSNAAVRYDAKQKPIPYYDFDHRGGSAVYASAHDLVRFGMFHLKQRVAGQQPVLRPATIDAMQRVETPGDTTSGYGLGWIIDTDQGTRVVYHTGGMPGVATSLKLFPEHDVAIAVLGNASGVVPHAIMFTVTGAVIPGYDASAAQREALAPPGPFVTPSALWGEWTGRVRMYDGDTMPITLLVKPDDVHVRLGDSQLWAVLTRPTFRDNLLSGGFLGTIPTDDARRHPHYLAVSLQHADGKLRGWAAAITTDDPVSGAVSSYAELTKTVAPRAAAPLPNEWRPSTRGRARDPRPSVRRRR